MFGLKSRLGLLLGLNLSVYLKSFKHLEKSGETVDLSCLFSMHLLIKSTSSFMSLTFFRAQRTTFVSISFSAFMAASSLFKQTIWLLKLISIFALYSANFNNFILSSWIFVSFRLLVSFLSTLFLLLPSLPSLLQSLEEVYVLVEGFLSKQA